MTSLITDRYASKIQGVLSCFDRVVIQGNLPHICYADGMARWLRTNEVRLYDYPRFVEPFNEKLRENAARLAKDSGCEIEYVTASLSKEKRIAQILAERGTAPGLVHVFSSMELCRTYRARYDDAKKMAFLKPDKGKCLHYYFYFIDASLGLCYVRVPTWCPFAIQFYFNGHNWLARKLDRAKVTYRMLDNAFVELGDVEKAQKLSDAFDTRQLHATLDRYAALCCPAAGEFDEKYHWTLSQVEYSTDVIFRRQSDLKPLYSAISRTAIHAAKASDVATFLGRKLTGNYQNEAGNDFSTRIEGTRIKHRMGPVSIKMYDKAAIVLRIETTANDVRFFSHHRRVEQRGGTSVFKLAPLKKTIHSLHDLRQLMSAANRRYLEFISALDDPSPALKALQRASAPTTYSGRRYRGLNFFSADDDLLLQALSRGEFAISGFRNKDIRGLLKDKKPAWISRCLKRLRVHGLLKSIGHRYKYYLSELGKRVVLAGQRVRDLVVIPALSPPIQVLPKTRTI